MTLRILALKRLVIVGILLGATFVISHPTSQAQGNNYAAILTVSRTGVEMLRMGAENWIALPVDATTPFGVGDKLRTDRTGRAYLQALDSEILVLPESQFEITTFEVSDTETGVFEANMNGRVVYAVSDTSQYQAFTVHAANLVVTQPSGRFAIQSRPNEDGYVVVADGEILLDANDETLTLTSDEGIRVSDSNSALVTIADVPINFARIESRLDGCGGTIETAGGVQLRVRAGPSADYFYMGSIGDGTPIEIMGIAPGGWYRIQFLSDFGWVLAETVITDCINLPEYPTFGVENAPGIVLVKDYEVPLLAPFFGQPADDVWFYRRLNQEDGSAPQTG